MMHPLLAYLLKMACCSGILLGYYWTALRNERFHQWNRFYLLSAMALSVIIPFFNIPIFTKEAEPTGVVYVLSSLPWNSLSANVPEASVWNWEAMIKLLAL